MWSDEYMFCTSRSCPIDLKEAITSVLFASPRCADIPELLDVKKHFTAKYGKEFVTSALELRPNCGVGRMVSLSTCHLPELLNPNGKSPRSLLSHHLISCCSWSRNYLLLHQMGRQKLKC